MEKRLKLVLYDHNRVVCILFLFVLLSTKADSVLKKRRSKKNLIRAFNSNGSKIILILITKILAFYLRFFVVYIGGVGF